MAKQEKGYTPAQIKDAEKLCQIMQKVPDVKNRKRPPYRLYGWRRNRDADCKENGGRSSMREAKWLSFGGRGGRATINIHETTSLLNRQGRR